VDERKFLASSSNGLCCYERTLVLGYERVHISNGRDL
jgi:hypothetical protein